MKKSMYFSGLFCLALFAGIACLTTLDAQTTGANNSTLTQAELEYWSNYVDDQIGSTDPCGKTADGDCDLTCQGECELDRDGCAIVCGVRVCPTLEKCITVNSLICGGLDDPCAWVDVVEYRGESNTVGLGMNTEEDARPSKILLYSEKGQGAFEFPARAYVVLDATMDVKGLDVTLYGTEPVILMSKNLLDQWPPKEKVEYTLMRPAHFMSADGKHTATYPSATVTMQPGSTTVALQ